MGKITSTVIIVGLVLIIIGLYYQNNPEALTNIKDYINPSNVSQEVVTESHNLTNVSGFMIPLNSRGAIPLEVKTIQTVDFRQYFLTYLLSAAFILFYVYAIFAEGIYSLSVRSSLRKLKKKHGRNILLIKHTTQAMFSSSMIDQTTMLKLNEALTKFKGQPFDLVLHTPGGNIFDSLLISRIIKNYPGEVRVFIPLYAMSGGTCLALSGKKIYMNEVSCMGPVDPQLGSFLKFGSAKAWNDILKFKGKRSDDQTISFALMGKQYTKTIANHLDFLLKERLPDNKQRKNFVTFLTDGKVEHAYALTPTELKKFNVEVEKIDESTNKILMKIITSKRYEGLYHTGGRK